MRRTHLIPSRPGRRLARALVLVAAAAALSPGAPLAVAGDAPGAVDVVVLTDGRRIEGEIVGQDADLVSIRAGGVLRAYPRRRVASIQQAARPAPLPAPDVEPVKVAAEVGATPAPTDRKRKRRERARAGGDTTELSAPAAAWLDRLIGTLSDRTGEADQAVTRSVLAAIKALGPAAAPHLEAAAAAHTGRPAEVLAKLASSARRAADQRRTDAPDAARRSDRRQADPMRTSDREIVGRLRRELDLDATQETALVAALGQHKKRQKDVLRRARDEGLDRPGAKALFQESRETFLADLRAELDDAQAVALGDIVRETMERKRQKKQKPKRKNTKKKPKNAPPTID